MPKYQIQTTGGTYEIETADAGAPAAPAAAPDNSTLGKISRGAAAFDQRVVSNLNPVNAVKGLMSAPDAEGLGKAVPSVISQDWADRGKLAEQAAADFHGGHYGAAAIHGLDSIVPILGPMVNRAGEAAASGSPERIGAAGGDLASLKAVPEVYGAAGRVAEAAKPAAEAAAKYGTRLKENAPAVGAAAAEAGKTVAGGVARGAVAHLVPAIGQPLSAVALLKTARDLVADGTFSDLRTAVGNLLKKPSTEEVMTASNARGQAVPWRGFPDVADEVASESEPLPAAALPSGRKAGGIENQTAPLAPNPLGPRRAPLWSNIPPAEAASAPEAVAAPVEAALPSGRRPGGIENQTAAEPKAVPQAATTGAAPATPERARTAAEAALMHAVDNKVSVLSHYAQTNGISLASFADAAGRVREFAQQSKLPETARRSQIRSAAAAAGRDDIVNAIDEEQAFADEAYAHGVANDLPVPKKGYNGISADTWALVRNRVPETAGTEASPKSVAESGHDAGRGGTTVRQSGPADERGIANAGQPDQSANGNEAGSSGRTLAGAQIEAKRRFARAKAQNAARQEAFEQRRKNK